MGMLFNRISDWANNVKGGDAKRAEALKSLDTFMALAATPPTRLLKQQQNNLYSFVKTGLLEICTKATNDPDRPRLEYMWQVGLNLICAADVREKARLGVSGFEKWNDPNYNRQIEAGNPYFPPGAKEYLDAMIAHIKN